jgi:transcriptional regulator with XRE-family HTH domain
VASKTVIEVARKAAGLSQRRLAEIARTQQSSVSEYESRRKSPTLEVVERLLDATNHELAVKPIVFFELREHPEGGSFVVPNRLWSVPLPKCLARVQVLMYLFETNEDQVWDLSDPAERIAYYEFALSRGTPDMLLDSVDGLLLIQAWPLLHLPEVVSDAWQPLIDSATAPQDGPPRDPGGVSARIASEIGLVWPPPNRRRRR